MDNLTKFGVFNFDDDSRNSNKEMKDKQNKLRKCLQENQFIIPSFTHYSGASGFHDYGVLGIRVKQKLINLWRDYFLLEDDISEIETPIVIPNELLKTSGHVDRFIDYVVYDQHQYCYRADHLVKNYFKENGLDGLASRVDSMPPRTLEKYINDYKMIIGEYDKKRDKHNSVKIVSKNLMFPVPSIKRGVVDYLRPELAQGLFVNFKMYQQYFHKDVPFGLAQVGKSYRNEISPIQFTRMREFTLAEIEYFVDPNNKIHPLFDNMKNQQIKILTSKMQQAGKYDLYTITVSEAVNRGFIRHKTTGYFLGRIYQFSLAIGLDEDKIRFRQHLPHEMAHYASECWDLETFINNNWLECIGCADRGCYDLQVHSKHGPLTLKRYIKEPIVTIDLKIILNKELIGQRYKNNTQKIITYFNNLSKEEIKSLQIKLSNGYDSICICIEDDILCTITKEMINFKECKTTITTEEYHPHVIEPSFGIDRLMYSIFYHNFWARSEDEKRIVLSLPKNLVPYDVAIFQLYNRDDMVEMVKKVKSILNDNKFSCYIDNSSVTIGKKYVRLDEIGVKYAITVDPSSLEDNHVTIRNRDDMTQIRVDIDKIIKTLISLS